MRILVTGAAGFIGFHTCRALLERGDDVIGLDNLNPFYDVTLKQARLAQLAPQTSFQFVKADLEDRAIIEKLFAEHRPQRVIHLAAQAGVRYSLSHPHDYVDANLVGFLHILEGCRHNGVEHLVYASSSSVYGANTAMPFSVHQHVDHPVSLYARDKKSQRIDGACLRPPVWTAGHGVALLHRLRALGPARHVDVPVHPRRSSTASRSRSSIRATTRATSLTSTTSSEAWCGVVTGSRRQTPTGTGRIPTPAHRRHPIGFTTSETICLPN